MTTILPLPFLKQTSHIIKQYMQNRERITIQTFHSNYKAEQLYLFPSIQSHFGFVFVHPEAG